MKKPVFQYIVVVMLMLSALLTGCRRHKTIPDGELKQIFREVYLTNAYVSEKHNLRMDSSDIYTPILEKHGYRFEDLTYTIANFSKRKSAKMSDIISAVQTELESESKYYRGRVAVLDTIDARATRMSARVVYEDTLIMATKISDTSDLRVSIPVRPGITYEVKYFYFIDSLDKNKGVKTTMQMLARGKRYSDSNTNWMNIHRRSNYTAKLTARDGDSVLLIRFGNYPKDMKRPHLRIDSLKVTRYLPKQEAIDSMNRKIWPFVLPEEILNRHDQKDSVALHLDSLWIAPRGRSDAR